MVIIRRLSLVAAVAVPCKAILQPRQVLMPTSSTLKIWGEPKVLVTRPLSQDDISINCLDNTQQGDLFLITYTFSCFQMLLRDDEFPSIATTVYMHYLCKAAIYVKVVWVWTDFKSS